MEGRPDDARAVRARRERAQRPRGDLRAAGTERPHAAAADAIRRAATLESARYDLSKVRIEVADRRHRHARATSKQGETAVIGTMNNAGTVLLHDRRHVGDRGRGRGRRDRHSRRQVRPDRRRSRSTRSPARRSPARSPRSATARSRPPAQPASTRRRTSRSTCTLDGEIPEVRPGFTCTAEITTATRDNVLAVPIQATTVREMVRRREGQHRARADRRPAQRRAGPAACRRPSSSPASRGRKLEGVFVVRDNKAQFVPVKTGIAGEKYFEVLSGLKDGDSVVVGPFSSVRTLADGAAGQGRSRRRAARRIDRPANMNQFLESAVDRAAARSGRTSCARS